MPVAVTTPRSSAAHDHGAHEGHVCLVPGSEAVLPKGLGGLEHRQGLAGEHRLFNPELLGRDQTEVGRHLVPRGQQHHIPGNERRAVHLDLVPIPQDARLRHGEPSQGPEALLGAQLLPGTDDGVDDDYREDDHRVLEQSEAGGDGCRQEKDVDERVLELVQKNP